MKKIVLLFIGLLLFSCSKDDNANEQLNILGELVVSIEEKVVSEGDRIYIHVSDAKGNKVEGARIYVDNVQVNALYSFDKVGTRSVVATKKGYNNSKALEIKVIGLEKLVLKPNYKNTVVGQRIDFSVFTADNKEVKDVIIYNELDGKEVSTVFYTPLKEGRYAFVARKKGFKESDKSEVIVHPKGNYFRVHQHYFEASVVVASIQQIKLPNNKIVDEVVVLDGVGMNKLMVTSLFIDEEFTVSSIEMTLLIPNTTVKIGKNKEVVDYGKRLNLNSIDHALVQQVVANSGSLSRTYSMAQGDLGNYELSPIKIALPNKGINFEGYTEGKLSLLSVENNDFYFNFEGELHFSEYVAE